MTMYNTPEAHAALHNAVILTTKAAAAIRDDNQSPNEIMDMLLALGIKLCDLAFHRQHEDGNPGGCGTCNALSKLTTGAIEVPRYRQTFKLNGCKKSRSRQKHVAKSAN